MSQGRATVEVDTDTTKRRILISNASVADLTATLKQLMVKFKCETPVKNKHLMINGELEDISPLRPKELEKINAKLNVENKNPTPRKNTTPVRRLQKRRILAERNGQLPKKEPAAKRLKFRVRNR